MNGSIPPLTAALLLSIASQGVLLAETKINLLPCTHVLTREQAHRRERDRQKALDAVVQWIQQTSAVPHSLHEIDGIPGFPFSQPKLLGTGDYQTGRSLGTRRLFESSMDFWVHLKQECARHGIKLRLQSIVIQGQWTPAWQQALREEFSAEILGILSRNPDFQLTIQNLEGAGFPAMQLLGHKRTSAKENRQYRFIFKSKIELLRWILLDVPRKFAGTPDLLEKIQASLETQLAAALQAEKRLSKMPR